MMSFTKQQLINLLRSAAQNKGIREYSYNPDVVGGDRVFLHDVLDFAADQIERYLPDEIDPEFANKRTLRSIIGTGRKFKVEKPFVYQKISFNEGDVIEITEFDIRNGNEFSLCSNSSRAVIHHIKWDYVDLSEMYEHNFISYLKQK